MSTCLHIVYACFCAKTAEYVICNRDCRVHMAENIIWPFAEKIYQPPMRSLKMLWAQSLLGVNEQFCFPLKEPVPFLSLTTGDP